MYIAAQHPDLMQQDIVRRGATCADGDVIVEASADVWDDLLAQKTLHREGHDCYAAGPISEVRLAVEGRGGAVWPVLGISTHERWQALSGHKIQEWVEHELTGGEWLLGHGWVLDGEALLPAANAPIIGAATDAVLKEYLSLPEAEIAALRDAKVLS